MTIKWLKYALGGILLTQLLTEMLPMLFPYGSPEQEYTYYISMRLFSIGIFPSLVILYFCKSRIDKVLGLTLVISQTFWLIRELFSLIDGMKWLVLRVTSIDICWLIFIILPFILSMLTDAIFNSRNSRNSRLHLLLFRLVKKRNQNK